ncbi:hypothetical protein XENTR_v10011238 [Xenopus tropicalis]|uniref:Chromosome 11 open reading frame 24 n=1 Tax=Xenopus tropicalis TaxID=8364 RepID=A0A6I8SIK7_XENTR|nr:uncharacterized protein C11orf24 homolog [Xenopus tropicalis]KAE8607650.1 hypothetical protein XENTR_v10011238 [Xenopus tropicalis]KAE8607651.1 hypothetical protein XENTR_v10011238 [Xenopus tropicalis]KAE8607652.1 hypothetical protein XENTR_v10011238 [Xenopus tropicalis]KAE8607653.1 hypothetical protein XENTR_v10011238 [Xenopus tropicalis]
MGRTGLLIWSVILCISVRKTESMTENGFTFLRVGEVSSELQCKRECKLAKLSGEIPCNWPVLIHNRCVFLHCHSLRICRKAGSSQTVQNLLDKNSQKKRRKINDQKSKYSGTPDAYRSNKHRLKRSLAKRFVKKRLVVKRQSGDLPVSDATISTLSSTSTTSTSTVAAMSTTEQTSTALATTAKPPTTSSILITMTKSSPTSSFLATTKTSTTISAETTTTKSSTSTSAITATTPTTILNPTSNIKSNETIVLESLPKNQVVTETPEQLHLVPTIEQIETINTTSKETFTMDAINSDHKTLSFEQETFKPTIRFTTVNKSITTKATTLQPTLERDLLTTTVSTLASATSLPAITMTTTAITLSTTTVPTSLSTVVPSTTIVPSTISSTTTVPTTISTTTVPTTTSTTTVPTTPMTTTLPTTPMPPTTITSTNAVTGILPSMTSTTLLKTQKSPDKITMSTPKLSASPTTVSNIGSPVGPPAEDTGQNKDGGGVYDVSEEVTLHVQNTSFLLAVLLLGNLLFIAIIVVFSLQAYESYKKKDYTQVDYLINGMYADSEI